MKRYMVSTSSMPPPKSGFYVYTLTNPLTQDVFYVGKGTGYRFSHHTRDGSLAKHSHKTHTIRQILETGQKIQVDIKFISPDEQECLTYEAALIHLLGKRTNGGILTNITDGGENPPRPIITDAFREARRKHFLGDANPTRGRQRTADECNQISDTRKTRIATGEIQPTTHTEAHKQRMRDHNPGGEATARAIHQIDPVTGSVINTWKSLRAAGLSLDIKTWRNISTTLTKLQNRVVAGFYWRWADDATDVTNGVLQDINQLNAVRMVHSNAKNYTIIQRDDVGQETEWENMLVAMQYTGIHNSGISAATKSGKKYGGFYWERRKR
jgi:hypothetical protein